jgi:hypothetical protein
MSALPDWVLKYKKKGLYARKTKTGYALYRGHSERVPGKSYPVFRCDEYLGIVTEEDGLRPSRPPVKPPIKVLRYGVSQMIESSCAVLRKHPEKLGLDADLLFVRAALSIEGRESPQGFSGSYLSRMFPTVDMQKPMNEQQQRYLSTLKLQVGAKLRDHYREDYEELRELCSQLYAVYVNGGWHLSEISQRLVYLAKKYAVVLKIGGDSHEV